MSSTPLLCRVAGCTETVPPALALEQLCLNHFIEQAFSRIGAALEDCRRGQNANPEALDWLLADAEFAVQALAQNDHVRTQAQRDKLLELLLSLSNLQDYVRHHSVQLRLSD